MALQSLTRGLLVLLLGAAVAPSLPPVPSDVPPRDSARGTFTVVVVQEVDRAQSEIMYSYTSHRQVAETIKEGAKATTQIVQRVETVPAKCSLTKFLLYDAKGTQLTAHNFLRRIKKGSLVLFCHDDVLPAPEQLRVFKDDALILLRMDEAAVSPTTTAPTIPTER